jgi:Glycosyl hydrolase family 65, N-terminal domain
MIHQGRLRPPSHDHPADEWNLIEERFRPEFLTQLEIMLALGNGYLGIRGCPEEGGLNAENGTFINGFYESRPIIYGEEAYGFPKTGQAMLHVTDSKIIKLFVDDEAFWLPNANFLSYDRRRLGVGTGYCIMIGGEKELFRKLDPIFATLAPGIEYFLVLAGERGSPARRSKVTSIVGLMAPATSLK